MLIRRGLVALMLLAIIAIIISGCKKQEANENENGDNTEVMITTYDPQDISETTVVCGGDARILQQGLSLSQIGICWSVSENPTINDQCVFSSNWQSPFVCTLQGLQASTTYHVRAYALRGLIVYYGEDKMFTTLASPVVNTIEVNAITQTSAVGIGEVISEGTTIVTERGFCWNTYGNPTINNNHISCGSGVGRFSAEITGLILGTTYYVRAYAINEVGISYGSEVVITTISDGPSLIAIEEEGFIRDGDTLIIGDVYNLGFFASSNAVTHAGLVSLSIWIDETNWREVDLFGASSYDFADVIVFSNYGAVLSEFTITASVTDDNGKVCTTSIRVFVIDSSDSLDIDSFEWIKIGSNPATGLEEFGLQWNYNAKEVFGWIEPLEGVLLFSFMPSDWDGVNTSFGKDALFSEAIENGIQISVYRGIHIEYAGWDYDDVIGTITPDGNYHLIHVTRSTVSNGVGVSIVRVTGETK